MAATWRNAERHAQARAEPKERAQAIAPPRRLVARGGTADFNAREERGVEPRGLGGLGFTVAQEVVGTARRTLATYCARSANALYPGRAERIAP